MTIYSTYTINILDKAQQLTRSAAHIWLTPGGGKTVLRFSLGCTDTRFGLPSCLYQTNHEFHFALS